MRVESSAPTRIGILGGGTDVEPYASKYGGICLSLAISLRQRVVLDTTLRGYRYPSGGNKSFYETLIRETGLNPVFVGLRACFDGVIESGIGSSAAAAVATLAAAYELRGNSPSPVTIAEIAWRTEVDKLGLYGGKQDQFTAALGGLNRFDFEGGVLVTAFDEEVVDKLVPHLSLFHTGVIRSNPRIQEGLKDLSPEQLCSLHEIKGRAQRGAELLKKKDIEGVGRLLDESWRLKRASNHGVSNLALDHYYDSAIKNGAWGGKVMGSGGGGYMMFMSSLERKGQMICALERLNIKQVNFEADNQGLKVTKG